MSRALFAIMILFSLQVICACKTASQMKKSLETYLADPSVDGFTLKYSIGNAFTGMTEFTLYGDTGYRLKSNYTKNRKEVEYAGYREQAEVTAICQVLLDEKVWDVPKDAPSTVPDDVRPRITVSLDGHEDSAAVWTAHFAQHPHFARADAAIRAFIQKISGGEILE
jgi:hypothetical protein